MKHAFTLIEVLVAIVIISIVMGFGVAAVSRLREDATTRMLEARVKQLNIAKQQFIGEYNRIEAEAVWAAASNEARYNYLKRYINLPPPTLLEFTPRDCTITTPTSVYDLYSGTHTLSNGTIKTITDTN